MVSPAAESLALRLEEARDKLLRQAGQVRPELFHQRPSPHEWSVGEILAHVADAQEFYLLMVQSMLGEEKPEIGRTETDAKRLAAVAQHGSDAFAQHEARIRAGGQDVRRTVLGFTEEQLARVGRHRVRGEMTVQQWLEFLATHLDSHTQHIAETVRALRPS